MAKAPTKRKATGTRPTVGKTGTRASRPAPVSAAAAHDFKDQWAEGRRTPGHHEIAMRAFQIYLARGEWPGRDLA